MKINRTDRVMAIQRHSDFIKDFDEYLNMDNEEDRKIRYKNLCTKWGEDILLVNTCRVNNIKNVYDYGIELQGKPSNDHSAGRYMYLKVDLTKTQDSLKKEFEAILKCLKEFGKHIDNSRRGAELYHDPWVIYDMIHSENLNLSQIAKKITGINKDPAYNEELHRVYKQIKYAYDKACNILNEINERVKVIKVPK